MRRVRRSVPWMWSMTRWKSVSQREVKTSTLEGRETEGEKEPYRGEIDERTGGCGRQEGVGGSFVARARQGGPCSAASWAGSRQGIDWARGKSTRSALDDTHSLGNRGCPGSSKRTRNSVIALLTRRPSASNFGERPRLSTDTSLRSVCKKTGGREAACQKTQSRGSAAESLICRLNLPNNTKSARQWARVVRGFTGRGGAARAPRPRRLAGHG